jgi:hypothetical protein
LSRHLEPVTRILNILLKQENNQGQRNLLLPFKEHSKSGGVTEEHQGKKPELDLLYDLVKSVYSNYEIIEHNPDYLFDISNRYSYIDC